jgi:hypothetical protein
LIEDGRIGPFHPVGLQEGLVVQFPQRLELFAVIHLHQLIVVHDDQAARL